jgi:hypothetical protein
MTDYLVNADGTRTPIEGGVRHRSQVSIIEAADRPLSIWGAVPVGPILDFGGFKINTRTAAVTLAEGTELDDAARLFWDAVRRLAPQLPA